MMPSLITVILIGISLSLDAFSLALIYGTLNLSRHKITILSIVVGIYHFIMPLIGSMVGIMVINKLIIAPNYIVAILFILIGLEMILSIFKEEKLMLLNLIGILIFGFAVSIDSFFTGIGLSFIYIDIIDCALIFSVLSCLFTYIGLLIGGKINQKLGKYSAVLGGICLLGIAIYYLTKN